MKKKMIFFIINICLCINVYSQQKSEEGDYLIFSFVKGKKDNINYNYTRFDWIVNVDSMKNPSFFIFPFIESGLFSIGDTFIHVDLAPLIRKNCKKLQTIKCYSKNGYKENIYVYVTPVHGELVKKQNGFYEAISDVEYTPSILKDKKRMKYLYSHYNYVPFTKHEPFKIPDY